MKERHLIGFSLSFCVKDICEGKVDINEVLFIQTGCNPVYEQDVQDILKQYCTNYWSKYEEQALEVFNTLMNDEDHPRIGWASAFQKNCVPIGWGNWLSTNNVVRP